MTLTAIRRDQPGMVAEATEVAEAATPETVAECF